MKEFYEILGLTEDATLEEVNDSYTKLCSLLYKERKDGKISRSEYAERFDKLTEAHDKIVLAHQEKAVAAAKATDVKKEVEATKQKEEAEAEPEKVAVVQEKKNGNGWKVATGVLTIALVTVLALGGLKGCSKDYGRTGANVTNETSVTETVGDTPKEEAEETEIIESEETTEVKGTEEVQETPSATETEEVEDYSNEQYVVDFGDVEDDTLVRARAQELADQLNAAGIVCPRTQLPYDVDHIFRIIKFLNGVLIPDSQEEIDLLYFDALDLTNAQSNTEYYLNHMNHATGESGDDFLQLIEDEAPNAIHVTFGEALTQYNGNGIWPLIQWIQEKRVQSFSTTDRAEKDAIMIEVYQKLADIMKGDGATITIHDGKSDKEGITYTFTHDQIVANPAAAFVLMQEAKYILFDCSIYDPNYTWDVYYSLNTSGVDENGYPIIEPDKVSLIEMEEYYNNGCYDSINSFGDEIGEQGIDQIWPDGKTMAQIIQMKIEGLALNNWVMAQDGKRLTK